MHACVCVCACVHVCVHVCEGARMCVCVLVHLSRCVRTCMRVYMRVHAFWTASQSMDIGVAACQVNPSDKSSLLYSYSSDWMSKGPWEL